jgi:hypothetical protein
MRTALGFRRTSRVKHPAAQRDRVPRRRLSSSRTPRPGLRPIRRAGRAVRGRRFRVADYACSPVRGGSPYGESTPTRRANQTAGQGFTYVAIRRIAAPLVVHPFLRRRLADPIRGRSSADQPRWSSLGRRCGIASRRLRVLHVVGVVFALSGLWGLFVAFGRRLFGGGHGHSVSEKSSPVTYPRSRRGKRTCGA